MTELYACIDVMGCGDLAFFLTEEPINGLTVPHSGNVLYPDGREVIDSVDVLTCNSCGQQIWPDQNHFIKVGQQ